jgi:hypothetical protein
MKRNGEFQITNDELTNRQAVIPSEVEESRGKIFGTIQRDPSTALRSAQDGSDFGIRVSSLIRHSSFVIRHCRNV